MRGDLARGCGWQGGIEENGGSKPPAGRPPSAFEKLASMFMAWAASCQHPGACFGMRVENCFGRFGRGDFFQRERGRSERRDVEPLQYRSTSSRSIKYSDSTGMIACSAFSHFSIRLDSWERCGCRPFFMGDCVLHANPLDGKAIARSCAALMQRSSCKQYQTCSRSICAVARPEQFGGLRLVVTGAEKYAQDRLAAAFEDRFGIRPLEGYGCTECAPCVATDAWI